MLNLITDRTASDASRIDRLLKKGMQNWTADERLYFFNGSGGYEAVSTLTDDIATLTDTVAVYVGNGVVRGAYNHTDLNRVTAAMDGIKARLEKDGYRVDGYRETVNEWSDSDAPRAAQLEAYLANVAAIRGVLDVLPTTPETPEDMDLLTWMEANDIEQILVDVETVAQSMRKIYRRSNQVAFYSGFGLWFTVADELPVLPDIYVSGEALSLAANASVSDGNLALAVGYTVGETLVL